MRALLSCLPLLLVLPASAQIYEYTDAKGNKVYTDQPPMGSQARDISLPPTNTIEPPKPIPAPSAPEPQATAPYQTLALSGLPDEQALRENDGTFSVGVDIQPPLAPGHRLRLLLDGQPYGQPGRGPRLQLSNVDRGQHSLAVEVLSGEQSLQQSQPVSFTVQRISLNSPARSAP